MERIVCFICLIVGYCFGIFQTAFIYGKIKGVDIRTKGSGNLGTTNMFRVIGIKAGLITFAGDILKVLAALAVAYFVVIKCMNLDIDRVALFLYTGFGVVLGHNYPFYLKFKGGKGVAASAAVFISIWDWRMILIGAGAFFILAFATQYVSLSSMAMAVAAYIAFAVFNLTGYIVIESKWLPDCYIIMAIMVILLIWQHRKNIKRLLNGTENKFKFKSEKEIKEEK